MSTPFKNIYNRFLDKITDFDYDELTEEEAFDVFEGFLLNAVPKFLSCKTDLSKRDLVLKQFDNILSDLEEELLSLMLITEWVTPKIYNVELMRQHMNTKEFQRYSEANHARELRGLRKDTRDEVAELISQYCYQGDVVGGLG